MRVLVTGASGLIGSAVCDALLARGDEVVGLSRDPGKARGSHPTVSWHAWDPANERPAEAVFERVDAVVNLVGEEINQRLTPEAKQRIHDSRVRATKNLVDAMLAASPSPATLVSQAAIGIYGDRGDAVLDESAPPADGFLPQLVVEWEHEARQAEAGGVRVVVLRTGLILDPEGGLLKQLVPPFRFGLGGPLAGGAWYMPWIHRDDEVGLILWAIDNASVSGTLNATAVVSPGAEARRRRDARTGARRADRRQPQGDPATRPGPRLRVPLQRGRAGAARPARALSAAPTAR